MARRFSAQRALHLLLNMTESDSNNDDAESDEENYYEGDEEVQIDQDGSGDNYAVHSENEDEGDIEIASNNSESSSESEIDEIRHEGLSANGIQYRSEPFDSRRRNRNVAGGTGSQGSCKPTFTNGSI